MKKAIVFVDANNWYHNVKNYRNPGEADIKKVADFIPSLELIKDKEKEVLVASVPSGFSKELRDKCEYFIIKRKTLNKCLKKWKDK